MWQGCDARTKEKCKKDAEGLPDVTRIRHVYVYIRAIAIYYITKAPVHSLPFFPHFIVYYNYNTMYE